MIEHNLKKRLKAWMPPAALHAMRSRVFRVHLTAPFADNTEMVKIASRHLESAPPTPIWNEQSDRRWDLLVLQMRADFPRLRTVSQVVHYAQTVVHFDHRCYRGDLYPMLDLAISILKSEFPAFEKLIDSIGDSLSS